MVPEEFSTIQGDPFFETANPAKYGCAKIKWRITQCMPRSIGKNNYDKPRELEKGSHTYRLIGWFLKPLNGRDQQLQQSTSKQDQCQPPIYKRWFIS